MSEVPLYSEARHAFLQVFSRLKRGSVFFTRLLKWGVESLHTAAKRGSNLYTQPLNRGVPRQTQSARARLLRSRHLGWKDGEGLAS